MSTPASARSKPASRQPKKLVLVSSVPPAKSREEMIAEAAYHLAEKRGFMPSCEQQDWFEAERTIRAQFPSA